MKNYTGLVVVAAFVAGAFLLFHSLGLDLHVHDHYVVVPLSAFLFWLSIGVAGVWYLIRLVRRSMSR